jgi:para-nitrobenzyl esterase
MGGLFALENPDDLIPLLGEKVMEMAKCYRSSRSKNTSTKEITQDIITDMFFRIPSIWVAEKHSSAGNPVYMYLFAWTNPDDPNIRPTHGSEGVFIFGNLDTTGPTKGVPSAKILSDKVQRCWLSFARNGDPNHKNIPLWNPYSKDGRYTMVFDDRVEEKKDPRGGDRICWEKFRNEGFSTGIF